jgi:hypothetical protein
VTTNYEKIVILPDKKGTVKSVYHNIKIIKKTD